MNFDDYSFVLNLQIAFGRIASFITGIRPIHEHGSSFHIQICSLITLLSVVAAQNLHISVRFIARNFLSYKSDNCQSSFLVCSYTDEWVMQMWYPYTMEYYYEK